MLDKLDAADQKLLDAALKSVTVETIMRTADSDIGIEHKATSRALHLRVDITDPTEVVLDWGSRYICKEVTERAAREQRQALMAFLEPIATGKQAGFRSVRGGMWEIWAIIKLREGDTTRVRKRKGPGDPFAEAVTHKVPASQSTLVFGDLQHVKTQPAGVFCQPSSLRFVAVDVLSKPCWLYQVTVNPDKTTVIASGLLDAINALGCAIQDAVLIIVVPPALFQKFEPLTVVQSRDPKKQVDDDTLASLQRVTQWIMEEK